MGILVALPVAAAIAILDKRKIEEFLFLAIGIIVSLIIVSGLLGNTVPGVCVSVALGVLATVYCITVFIKDRERFRTAVDTPGLWGALLCMGVAALIFMGRTDLGKDNDTFWAHAPQVLNMYRFSDIGNVGNRSKYYMLLYTAPVYTSWCYFCNKLWFNYSDGINLWARQIFILSAFLPVFTGLRKKDGKRIVLLSLILMTLQYLIDFSTDFMPDIPVAGAMVYGTLMTIRMFRSERRYNDPGYLAGACVWLALLCVMKRAGGIYTYGIVGTAALYTLERLAQKEQKTEGFRRIMPLVCMAAAVSMTLCYSLYRGKYLYQDKLFVLMPFAGFLLFLGLGVFCVIIKKMLREKKIITLSSFLLALFFCGVRALLVIAELMQGRMYTEGGADSTEILYRFFSMWFTRQYFVGNRFGSGWKISDFLYVLILAGILLYVRRLAEQKKITLTGTIADLDNVILPVFSGYVVYMLFYCFIYMTAGEGYILDDNIGYADRYFGPALLLSSVIVLCELLEIRKINRTKLLVAVLLFLMILLPHNPFQVLQLEHDTGWDKYNRMYKAAGLELTENDFLLCIGPDHCQYYVFPAASELDYDVKAAQTSPEEWAEQIAHEGYRYLLLEDFDARFPDVYQDMFVGGIDSIQKWAIYDIIVDGNDVKFMRRAYPVEDIT
ncbi:MAG: hypothetical protein IKN07_10825 [Lachnospiraceae bacterium]|nr:hypothetical protein [Lachnospiraceae bacterium]